MVWNRVPEEAGRGLKLWCDKEFLDVKVRSAVFTAAASGGMRACRPTMHNSAGRRAGCPHPAAPTPARKIKVQARA